MGWKFLSVAGLRVTSTVKQWHARLLRRNHSLALQRELVELVQLGEDSNVTLHDLTYFLNDDVRTNLENAAYFHLKHAQFGKFTCKLFAECQTIVLWGPDGAEPYSQIIAKALAHKFEAKLLLLDLIDLASKCNIAALRMERALRPFALKVLARSLYDWIRYSKKSARSTSYKPQNSEDLSIKSEIGNNQRWEFDEEIFMDALFKILASLCETSAVVVYLRDVENFFKGPKMKTMFLSKLRKLQSPIMILGSINRPYDRKDVKLAQLFCRKIVFGPRADERLASWISRVEEDMKAILVQDNRNRLILMLCANNLDCDDIMSLGLSDSQLLSINFMEEAVMAALVHHLQHTEAQYRGGNMVISSKSLAHGLATFQKLRFYSNKLKDEPNMRLEESPQICIGKSDIPSNKLESELTTQPNKGLEYSTPTGNTKGNPVIPVADVTMKRMACATDNETEKEIRRMVIPAREIGVNFQDIGALENVKESLQELVMLPLRRPEFFNRGGIIKRCKGILLFGPPGTGKTMLAKAVATESGATFINFSTSTVSSKCFAGDEKIVRALFALAVKMSPTVFFIDEVDSVLANRGKIRNEIMAHWDGLLTKGTERVLILAATNRPFDLDHATIRQFERRIMVGLPDTENREKILRTILAKENLPTEFDFKEIATMTKGYSGSDLKNLCVTAAYRPIREYMAEELKEEKTKKLCVTAAYRPIRECIAEELKEEKPKKAGKGIKIELEIVKTPTTVSCLRPLNLDDIRDAKQHVSASFASEGTHMKELLDWNDLYGEGGPRKKHQLNYFL